MPITFTSGDDVYTVSAAGTYDLDFLGGSDRLNVYGGDATVAHMGDGNDLAVIKAGLDTIFGDAGSDRFEVYASNATVDGGAGSDMINIRSGSGLTAHGGLDGDRFNFYADTSGVTLYGDDGNDDFFGYYHAVAGSLLGGSGNDYFVQFVAGASLLGGLGNDIYRVTVGSPATIVENAAEGTDSVQVARGYSYTLADNVENISVQGFAGSVLTAATLTGNALNNRIVGHNNDETILGLDGNDNLNAKGGADVLVGGNGNDVLDGGTGDDTLQGGAGTDTLQGRSGNDAMIGGSGNDVYYVDSSSDTVTELAGEGTDTVRVSVDYSLGANVENGIIQSGLGGVTLSGNGLANQLFGNSSANDLYGLGGNDALNAGAGDDYLDGGLGDDVMSGGAGNDQYLVSQAGDLVVEAVGAGDADYVVSELYDYTLTANVENGFIVDGIMMANLHGNDLDNILIAADLGSALYGGAGNDTLTGWADGGDSLEGGDGYDILIGRGGADYMDGGANGDVYVYEAVSDIVWGETVTVNFADGDMIDLSALDADSTVAGNQAFHFSPTGATDGTAGCLWTVDAPDAPLFYALYGDLNGDGTADFGILVNVDQEGFTMWAGESITF